MSKNLFTLVLAIMAIVLFIPVLLFTTSKTASSAPGNEIKMEQKPVTQAPAVTVVSTNNTSKLTVSPQPVSTQSPVMVTTANASEYFYELAKSPKYEMRGVWIATVMNIDMPSGMSGQAFRKWASEACQNASDRNLNTIVFQVKPTADAMYKSRLAPWSLYLNGEAQGKDPGYDPLAIMLEEAHGRGIELHAWINPYRITMASQKLDSLSKDSAAVKNPSWVIGYNNQFYFNPGLPEVRKYLVDCVEELVANYDIDAVHMDDYFYPYPAKGIPFPDSDAFAKYGTGFKTVDEWRRNNVNTLVADINRKIKEIKPYVQFGISPFGVWRNIANDPSGSATKAGIENYDSLHADTRQWLKDGSIDYLAPQIYWSRISDAANYTVLIEWWNNEVLKYASSAQGDENAHPVNLYVGAADYKVGTNNDEAWEKTNTEITGQITDNYAKKAITGQIHYNYSSVIQNPMGYFDLVKANNYKNMALTPPAPWNGLEQVSPPEKVDVEFTKAGLNVKIKSTLPSNARKYVIYRFNSKAPAAYTNENIIAVVYNNGETVEYLDKNVSKAVGYVYSVRAVSPTGVESEASANSAEVWF